jgi:hypothetical protein
MSKSSFLTSKSDKDPDPGPHGIALVWLPGSGSALKPMQTPKPWHQGYERSPIGKPLIFPGKVLKEVWSSKKKTKAKVIC